MDDIDCLRGEISQLLTLESATMTRGRRVRAIHLWLSELGLNTLFGLYLRHRYGAETMAELQDSEVVDCGRWVADVHRRAIVGPPDGECGPSP